MQKSMPQNQHPTVGLSEGTRVLHEVQGISASVMLGSSPWLHWHCKSLTSTADFKEEGVGLVEPSNGDGGEPGRDCDSPEHEGHASQSQRLEEIISTIMGDGCGRVIGVFTEQLRGIERTCSWH